MKRNASIPFLLLGLISVAAIVGCGGSGYTPPPPPPVVNVAISNPIPALDQGQSFNFTATTNDPSGKGVSWSLMGPGTLTNTTSTAATYTAPSSVTSTTSATITATSVTNPADSFPLPFNVAPPPTITTTSPLPDGNVGTSYNTNILTTGGAGNFTFNITNGTLPPGLTMFSSSGVIVGIPLFPPPNTFNLPHTYSFSATVTDTTPAGAVTSPQANLSINIGPPLPLMITTQPPLPVGNVGFNYDFGAFRLSATGGVQPYTFGLSAGSSSPPAGLTLTNSNNQGVISGTPTAAGTTNNIIVQVTDAQPVTSPTVTYSITVNPSTSFVGTQAPGDIWQLSVSHNDANDGIFKATDQGASGLPGTTTATLIKTFSTVVAGFRRYASRFFCRGFRRCSVVYEYAVEMQDEMALMQPHETTSKVVAAVANTCPQISATFPATANYQFVSLPTKTFSMTDTAYGNLALTQTAANNYNLTFSAFQLSGTANPQTMVSGLPCDANLQVLSLGGAIPGPVTMAFSGHGALVIDNGTGIPAVGLQQPASNLSTNLILAGQYLGVVFQPNAPGGLITQMVGFGGANPGATLTGGAYANIQTDAFSAHLTDHVITLGATQTSPGLFPGGTLAIGTKTITNFDVVAGQVNGKFVLYGIGLDTSVSASPQPTVVLLIQQ